MVQGINATAERHLVGKDNTNVHSQKGASKPPAKWISNKVNLLASVILSPEADTAQQEGPLVRVAGVRVAARELVVVVEHCTLQLKPLLEEGHCLDLLLGLLATGISSIQRRNVLNQPNVGAWSNLLVSIDFLLFVAPLRQRLGVSPHSNLARVVNELEVAGNGFKVLVSLAVVNADLEESIILAGAVSILVGDGGELLVRGIGRRCNIVRKQDGVRGNVLESNQVVILDIYARLLVITSGDDLPVVVGVVERISGNLLALAGDASIIVA